MKDIPDLLQTFTIMAACIVFLSKQAVDAYRSRNGKAAPQFSDESSRLVKDLHKWHKPVMDPETGQPRFMWYADSKELKQELKASRITMAELGDSIDTLATAVQKSNEG